MSKIEFIPNHNKVKCYRCSGSGKEEDKICPTCDGTGEWIEKSYYLIYTDKNGIKNGFLVDGLK